MGYICVAVLRADDLPELEKAVWKMTDNTGLRQDTCAMVAERYPDQCVYPLILSLDGGRLIDILPLTKFDGHALIVYASDVIKAAAAGEEWDELAVLQTGIINCLPADSCRYFVSVENTFDMLRLSADMRDILHIGVPDYVKPPCRLCVDLPAGTAAPLLCGECFIIDSADFCDSLESAPELFRIHAENQRNFA